MQHKDPPQVQKQLLEHMALSYLALTINSVNAEKLGTRENFQNIVEGIGV